MALYCKPAQSLTVHLVRLTAALATVTVLASVSMAVLAAARATMAKAKAEEGRKYELLDDNPEVAEYVGDHRGSAPEIHPQFTLSATSQNNGSTV